MQIEQRQEQRQALLLTMAMRQSLQCLQMSLPELEKYLQEQALSNPMLELECPKEVLEVPQVISLKLREQDWYGTIGEEDSEQTMGDRDAVSLVDDLNQQLGQMRWLSEKQLQLCRYLVGCLNDWGYLDCPLSELAAELEVPLFELEQALYVVQMLEPAGVGAADLSECLLLQLAQSRSFNAHTVKLVREGLPLLARRDEQGIAKLLGLRLPQAREVMAAILALNPIPSRGYASAAPTGYIVPEATVYRDGELITVELNRQRMPHLELSNEYRQLLEQTQDGEVADYLKEKLSDAKSLFRSVAERNDTLSRLLTALVQHQRGFFMGESEVCPLTMGQMAEELQVHTSTVSRAVHEKYLQFEGQVISLRDFFTGSVAADMGGELSVHGVQRQMRQLIRGEDTAHPLSDENLRCKLEEQGIVISRRTVAKYRESMGIPAASQRRNRER